MSVSFYSSPPPFFTNQKSSPSSSTSIIIVIIIISSAIIVSASLYLLLRFLSRRYHRSFRTFSAADDVISPPQTQTFLTSLPLFTFSSLTGKLVAGDCAVCLSKFEPIDQLRLLPLCCHAFHASCIDAWLITNQTCPLCRSPVHPTESDLINKLTEENNRSNSFRIEIGSVSRRRTPTDSGRRSYSLGSFEYIVDDGYEVSIDSTHRSETGINISDDKDFINPPGDSVAGEVSSGRSWLRDYVDRSFRSSGRFFTGSSRRSDVVLAEDVEANRIGEEISELFRWLSGV